MGVIVNSGKQKSPNRDVNEPSNDLAAEHLHTSAFTACGDCEEDADQSKQCTRSAYAEMPSEAAQKVARDSGKHVDEEKSSRAIQLFNLRPDIHQHPHVEDDVHQAAVKKYSHGKAPGLSNVVRQRQR